MTETQSDKLGSGLILLGILLLLGSAGLFGGMLGLSTTLLLGLMGALFARLYFTDTRRIWSIPVAAALFAAAVSASSGTLAGAAFLAVFAAGFAFIHQQHSRHWWAVIPAGVLGTLALIAGVASALPRFAGLTPVILFLGLGVTFAYLYLMPKHKQGWAIYPAITATLLAILVGSFTSHWLLPFMLIATGIYLRKRHEHKVTSPMTNS